MTCLQSHILNAPASEVFTSLSRHSGMSMSPHGYTKSSDAVGAHNTASTLSVGIPNPQLHSFPGRVNSCRPWPVTIMHGIQKASPLLKLELTLCCALCSRTTPGSDRSSSEAEVTFLLQFCSFFLTHSPLHPLLPLLRALPQ